MNDQPQMMKQQPPPVSTMNPAVYNALNPAPVGQPHIMNPNQPMMIMNHQQRSYQPWKLQPQQGHGFIPSKPRTGNNWKGKNVKPTNMTVGTTNITTASGGASTIGYKPPSLNELQSQNRLKARKYYHPRKKFNNRFAPYAPRNTTSFIIRAKKSGGIASLVSPCPVTPAVLPTPIFSPSREVLGDMAKEEWGVDGYGSMKGLIRLRSPHGADDEEDDEGGGNGSSESDVEEHVEVERRLDHDLSRFEMIYPSYSECGGGYNNILENRVDDQDMHIAQLEEENLTLKERLFLIERELGDVRRRLQVLESRSRVVGCGSVDDVNEEVVENAYANQENESDGGSDVGGGSANNEVTKEESRDVCMEEMMPTNEEIMKDGETKVGEAGSRLGESHEWKSEDMKNMVAEGDHAVFAKSGTDTKMMPTNEGIINGGEANDGKAGSMLGKTDELKDEDAENMVAEGGNAMVATSGGGDIMD